MKYINKAFYDSFIKMKSENKEEGVRDQILQFIKKFENENKEQLTTNGIHLLEIIKEEISQPVQSKAKKPRATPNQNDLYDSYVKIDYD